MYMGIGEKHDRGFEWELFALVKRINKAAVREPVESVLYQGNQETCHALLSCKRIAQQDAQKSAEQREVLTHFVALKAFPLGGGVDRSG
ncbi:MAG: hypothetical protein NNA30_10165 [Nitrospira sp.]|nr:hypothetical protein [Nitrospira sp.]